MTDPEIEAALDRMSDIQRRDLLRLLRNRYRVAIHPLEQKWNTTAEAILQAIDESPDLTQRGVRGVLAEASFRTNVVPQQLPHWQIRPFEGDQAFDLLLADQVGDVRVQVKLQRKQKGAPKLYQRNPDTFVVETQRTRTGTAADKTQTRPYRVNDFDVLAVSLQPSTGDWTTFIYCASPDLAVRPHEPTLLQVMQPIPMKGPGPWTRDFDTAVRRYRDAKASEAGLQTDIPFT